MLKDKVIVVTGGAGLIGRKFVKAISQHNGIAVIADIDLAAAQRVRDELTHELSQGNNVEAIELDITSTDSIRSTIDHLHRKFGHIDALVNNAYPRNTGYGKHFFEVGYESFCENVNLNLGGYFLASQQFAKYFKEQGGGSIVNIASIYGVMAPKFEIYAGTSMTMPVEYAVIKSALLHLTKYMAKYLKGTGIRVLSRIHMYEPTRQAEMWGCGVGV
jgi:NAD(P)-dependent dehydrogenase (short-subunit alcohol dehydrogenase family)